MARKAAAACLANHAMMGSGGFLALLVKENLLELDGSIAYDRLV
jgi:hypothetical protein